jgi:hypothetical protein
MSYWPSLEGGLYIVGGCRERGVEREEISRQQALVAMGFVYLFI